MEINYRVTGLLKILLASDGHISVQAVMEMAGLSRRALLYNMEKLNAFFRELEVSPAEICRGAISWDISQEGRVKQALGRWQNTRYALSKQEREAMVIIWAAVSHEPVTLEALCTLFDVSRNTVVTEVGELKSRLAAAGLGLNSQGRSGYRLEGEETTIRYYVMECLYNLSADHAQQQAHDCILKAAGHICGRAVSDEDRRALCGIVAEAETQTGLRFNNSAIEEAALYLLLILVRADMGHRTSLGEELAGTDEYAAAGTILRRMEEENLSIPVTEQSYITTVLLASKVFDLDKQPGDEIDLAAFAEDLVDTFSAKACVRFEERDELVGRLLLHVRPMYYRLKYKIKVHNVLTEEIRGRYRELYNLTDLSVKTVEPRYGLSIPDDEIAYLCVYIGGWMRRSLAPESGTMTRILIVCGTGVGTSLLLRDQLSALLGQGYLYVTKDQRETSRSDGVEYQLVVTTVELDWTGSNMIRVNPILTQSQQNKLLAWSAEVSGSGDVERVGHILDIVRRHAVISDEGMLTNALYAYLTHGKDGGEEETASISDVLPPDHFELIETSMDGQKAILHSCRPLLRKGIVGPGYAKSILEIIDLQGLYAEIADGILLAHGKPDESIRGVGLTLTLFRHPVLFPKWDKEIRVIFTLATPDNEAHLFILRDIMKLVRHSDTCKRLTRCDFANTEEAYAFTVRELGNL